MDYSIKDYGINGIGHSGYSRESSAYDFSALHQYETSAENAAIRRRYNLDLFDRATGSRSKTGRVTRTTINGAVRRTTDTRTRTVHRTRSEAAAAADSKPRLRTALIIRTAIACAVTVFFLTMLIISQVRSHELTRSIQDKQNELTVLRQEYSIMMDQFNTEMSDTAIEEYAASNFGMQRAESSQTEYVSLDSEEYFEFGTENRNSWVRND